MARIQEILARREAGGDSEIDSSGQMGGPREEFKVLSFGEVIGRQSCDQNVDLNRGTSVDGGADNQLGLQRGKYELPVSVRRYGTKAQERGWTGGREGRDSHLGVIYLCRCKLKTGEKDQENHVGRHGVGGGHPLDMIRLPFFKASR